MKGGLLGDWTITSFKELPLRRQARTGHLRAPGHLRSPFQVTEYEGVITLGGPTMSARAGSSPMVC